MAGKETQLQRMIHEMVKMKKRPEMEWIEVFIHEGRDSSRAK